MSSITSGSASRAPFPGHVARLPLDHEVGVRREEARERRRARLGPGEQVLEGERLEAVADEDRGRLVERLVDGGPAAAQVVVVHGGEIVVHEGVGVDGLERHREAHRERPVRDVAAVGLARGEDERRAQALPAAEERVAHRLDEPRRTLPGAGVGERGEPRLDASGDAAEVLLDREPSAQAAPF